MLRRVITMVLLLAAVWPLQAQWLPEKTSRLVNDYSGILTVQQREVLERRLVAFDDSTSNQVLIIITPTLGGDDEQAVAQRIGEGWGVGQKEFDNGVVILIKSKTPDEDWGAVTIATGYGVEGVLPDLFCKRIIDDKMIPPLSEGDYYGAVNEALDVMLPVLAGEYSYAQYRKDERRSALVSLGVLALLFVVAVVALAIYAKKHPDQFHGGGTGGGMSGFVGGPIIWGRGSSGGGWGSSGGFGGFGGFGGGSFGGGGASGRF